MKETSKLILIALLLFSACQTEVKYNGWPQYKGSGESIHYSALAELDTTNVKDLKVAWEYHTGDADTVHHSQIQCNPIVIDGVLYGTTPKTKLFALDAASGKERWVFNPFDSLAGNNGMFFILNNSRGVAFWGDGAKNGRLYYTAGSYLYCVNALSGKAVTEFGDSGKLDLHEGLGRKVDDLFMTATSPPIIYNDLLIMGSRVDEGAAAAPGHIRAYDVRTGRQRWIFHTIPHPGEEGYQTWDDPEAYKFIGGANAWSGFSLDKERGIVYASTGSASYDFYGGKRTGDNLFADCVLALDAKTGKRIWHFQDIHHDVWDRDIPAPPALVTVTRGGKKLDAVAVATKTGFLFVFDRVTGKPLYDIVEKPVPHVSELAGEKLSPTQPYPASLAPFMRQKFAVEDINPLLPPDEYNDVKARLAGYKSDHMYNPPSLRGTVVFPGLDGGAEWGGPSFDPETGILYINANEMAWVITAVEIPEKAKTKETYEQAGRRLYQSNCMTCHGPDLKGSGNFPSLIGIEGSYQKGTMDSLLVTGRRMMPAFKQLNQNEREAIASYVLNLTSEKKKEFTRANGEDVYKLPYSITGYHKFLSKSGHPALAPPWGTLNAVNLNTGKPVWKRTLGHDSTFRDASEPTGTENYGASVVTKGGLLFIAATKDGKFRAFNKRTGALLWEVDLPAPGFATPAIYEIDGRQYVVIACGGGKLGTRSGDSYVCFALPPK